MDRRLEGWPLLGVISIALLAMTLVCLVFAGFDSDGARLVIRATARTSVVLFGGAYIASSLVQLWRHPSSKWLLRNRRYVGVGFGVSHGIHYAAVVAFLLLEPEIFDAENGPLGYEKLYPIIMLALLVATSFDRAVKVLGRRAWKAIHVVGVHSYWVLFLVAFGKLSAGSIFYSSFTVFIVGLMVVRLAPMGQRVWKRRAA